MEIENRSVQIGIYASLKHFSLGYSHEGSPERTIPYGTQSEGIFSRPCCLSYFLFSIFREVKVHLFNNSLDPPLIFLNGYKLIY